MADELDQGAKTWQIEMRPEFIPRDVFRSHLTLSALNKLFCVDGIAVSSFIARCERKGRPIRHLLDGGTKKWRPIDVVARATADAAPVTATYICVLRKNIADLENLERELNTRVLNLQHELCTTVAEITLQKHVTALDQVSNRLTGKTLLREHEIRAGKLPIVETCGVYFLIDEDEIVYVGQSVDVFSRVKHHRTDKQFDSFAYISCNRSHLDILESLYIHTLRPRLNGTFITKTGMHVCAPMSLESILTNLANNTNAVG